MDNKSAIFERICVLCEEADEAGLTDVALVLEFALDVFLKETGTAVTPPEADASGTVERSTNKPEVCLASAPLDTPGTGWSMSTFPLAALDRKAS